MPAELAARPTVRADGSTCAGVEVEYVDSDRGAGTEATGGPLVGAVRAGEPGAGLRVIPGSAELAGLVVVLPHQRARRLGVVG